jgi:hypothetical protein
MAKKSKRRQPRGLKHKVKEADEHKPECKPEHKANNRDEDKMPDMFLHFKFKTYIFQDQPFSHRQECDGGVKLI